MVYYLIGIKGSGMASLANILCDMKFEVRGVDYKEDFFTTKEFSNSIIVENFENMRLEDSFVYIIGNAFISHPVTSFIINNGYHYHFYPKFIDELFNITKIAVSGTHGKTTTTKMIAALRDYQCSYLIGDGTGGSKTEDFFVFEACEYKETFLNYHPKYLVITNIDYDHPDYYDSILDVYNSFNKMAEQSEYVICNGDDKYCQKINVFNKITYGFNENNDLYCEYEIAENGYDLTLHYMGVSNKVFFPFLGTHLLYDFLASYLCLRCLGISNEEIEENIYNIELPKRRLEQKKIDNKVIITDYSHHPNEIKAFYESISLMYPDYKKILIFQPHTNTRTIKFKYDFKKALGLFDKTYLVDVFTSIREFNDDDIFIEMLDFFDVEAYTTSVMKQLMKEEKVVIGYVGAGDIDKRYQDLIKEFKR